MSGPLTKTLEVLSKSASPEANSVLWAGVDSTYEQVVLPCVLVLFDREGTKGQREVLSRFPRLPSTVQQALRSRAEQFEELFKKLLTSSTSEQCLEGLNGVKWLLAVDQIPRLTDLLCRSDSAMLDATTECLHELVVLLEEELRATSIAEIARSTLTARRDRALAHLEAAIKKYEDLAVKDPVVESILILGPLLHPAVKFLLWHAPPDCRERAGKLLMTSRNPKVIRQVLDSMRQSYPHPKAFEAIRLRTDVEFLCELFRYCSNKATPLLEQNLKQIHHLAWLTEIHPPWDLIPPALQPAMLSFVLSTKVTPDLKAKTQDWLLRHGGPEGRMAAAEHAAMMDENALQDVLVDSLNAEDEHVQAWAVSQLRHHAVPEAFSLLLERLDSPSLEVQAAAREELSDFNLDRALNLLDSLDATTALRVGELVRKLDAEAPGKLEKELLGTIRPRRIRAAVAIVRLGFHDLLLPPLLALVNDSDEMVRRMLAALLVSVLDPDVLPALEQLANDSHPRVREAALQALNVWQKNSALQMDPMLANVGP